jgi:hypothetical protein
VFDRFVDYGSVVMTSAELAAAWSRCVVEDGHNGTMRSAISNVERRCATITRVIGRWRIASLIARSFSSSRWLVASSSSRMRGFDARGPLARDIAAYQKHRVKRLNRQRS